jgi:hypothetical protein
MNILQLCCFEESGKIFDYLTRFLNNDSAIKFELAKHRDNVMGVQAIHLASAGGNRYFIDKLIEQYGADPKEKTEYN